MRIWRQIHRFVRCFVLSLLLLLLLVLICHNRSRNGGKVIFSQCRCETSCWRIAQCNMGCLAIFMLREALHGVELNSTFRNGLQQLTIPLHSVSYLQQLVSQFYGIFNKGECAHFLCFVPRSIARQVAVKIAQCNRASTPNLSNLQR